MRTFVRTIVASAALSFGFLGLGAAVAGASPTNAPSSQSGTFTCPGDVTGMFTVNSGNTHAAQTWNVAHLVFDSGATGIFVPTTLSLTFTPTGGTPASFTVTKGSAPSSVTCTISESTPQFTLFGTATGNIVMTG